MPLRPAPDYRQHLEVETPEHVVLDYEVAGVGSRALAAIADWLILLVVILVVGFSLSFSVGSARWVLAVLLLLLFATVWGYFTLFEGLMRGQTPGKRWLGIRVIRDTGHAVTVSDAAARNLLLPIDLFGFLGILFIAIHPRAKRIGDLVAGTVVVRDRPTYHLAPPLEPGAAASEESAGAPLLGDEEFRFLREFAERAPELPPEVRSRHAGRLAERLAGKFPDRPADDVVFLLGVYGDELSRRRGRFGARTGTAGGGSVAERLVARKGTRWEEFAAMAERVNRSGLDVLTAPELPDFARRYREIAADLARARTYHADARILARLERLVAAGHNALYREERNTWWAIWVSITRECPAAVLAQYRPVVLACAAFMLPAVAGYALLREQPALAAEVLPDVVLERAEAGAGRQAGGRGYVEAMAGDRPLIASSIITNNLQVAFTCFAGGIVLGVGSLVLLAFNGLQIGAVSGHFANAGLLGYLWTFVIGHGVLELFAIWVSGAAGFLLGRALIAPGTMARRDALVLSGRAAIRMVGMAVVLLLVAGAIEGFISAGSWPLSVRLGVSGGSVVFLVLYLLNGTRKPAA